MGTKNVEFEIADPRPIAAKAPYTFFLPSQDELVAVGAGDLAKLMFEYFGDVERWGAERMWVKVQSADSDTLIGTLENEPDESNSPLEFGQSITFDRNHILSILWNDPDTAPPRQDYREYWERCLVDSCVLTGEEPVEYLYREEPEMAAEGDEYPDSGWRIRGRIGSASDAEMDARKAEYVALGAVLNRDDSWIGWIDFPSGTSLMRDFDSGTYVQQS